MAKIRSNFETPNARLRLAVRKKSYSLSIAPKIQLLYRRNLGAGAWSVKTKAWMEKFAVADDFEPANGGTVMNYWQALDKARELARIGEGNSGKLITVSEALDDYAADLKSRGGHPINATSVRFNLPEALLTKTVAMLRARELRDWRNGLVTQGLAPATADRLGRSLKACLNLAARNDRRIQNAGEWREALGRLKGSNRTRDNVILTDQQIAALVAALRQESPQLGLWALLLAQTGARESQCVKLRVRDLQDGANPRLMLPTSMKGRNREQGHRPVTITPALAKALKANARGRKAGEPLIDRIKKLCDRFRPALDRLGHGPEITPYSLRHSSIVRQLLRNVPIRVVASHHDTSVGEIERVYSRHISDVAGDLTRATLSDFAA